MKALRPALIAVGLVLASGAAAQAAVIVGRETLSGGFTGELFNAKGFTGYMVASDGESVFRPFGATFDVSDGIMLNNPFNWKQAPGSTWTMLNATTWVLPANLGKCGSENEPRCEPVGHFISATPWNPAFTGTYDILDSNGRVSDELTLYNNRVGANIVFYSDPIPEPVTLSLFGVGIAGAVAMRRRRKDQKTN